MGSIGDYESTQEKIKNGYVFKVNLKPYIVEKFNYVRSNANDCFVHFTTINGELKQNTTDSNI